MANVDPIIERQREIFLKALEKSAPAERAAYLDGACGDDAALRAEVERLLQHHTADNFLESPALDGGRTIRVEAISSEGPGTVIGRYKLLQKIGEGGCGIVYMAEQEQPVRRRVALKVIKLGMDTKSVIARFEAEQQALALMDHPNIAKVFDAGATQSPHPASGHPLPSDGRGAGGEGYLPAGRPYFVMELVRGVKITDYCDEKSFSTQQRLDLFIQVCHAIQHAHQKGIIHRDIKPSNILVTVNDGVAVPKVIDFGIAKATTDQRLTDKTVFTAFEQFIGTPAYMSPEQAEITSVDVDTRSDIYSLGVLLYELLTGKTPFDAKELLQAGLDEMRRTIREKEPERPSTRVSTLDGEELTTTAKRRGLEPLKLVNALRGDLDWIVMKCLEKDRARRYETANGLASDIRRHLNSEPVVACPPSKLYRFQKMVRRNKLTFAATSAIAAALLIGFGVSTWMFVREGEAKREQMRLRQEADSARSQAKADAKAARTEAGKSREVSQFLKDMLRGVGPSVALGRDTTMLREILDKTTERVGKELANEPETEVELRNTLAEVCQELGLYDKMEKMARENVQLARAQLGQQNALLADALAELGAAMRGRGNDAEAESIFREALFLYRKLPGNHTKDIAWCLDELGSALGGQDKLVEAESLHREALETMKSVVGKEAPELATILNNLAILVSRHTHRQPEAEMLQREALEMNRKFSGNQSPNVATDLNNLAAILNEEGKLPEAESMYRQAVEMNEMLLGKDHPKVAINLDNLGANLQRQGRLKEAEALHRRALEMNAKSFGSNSPAVAGSFGILAYALQEEGKIAEAEQALVARLTTLKKLEADTPGPALGARNDVMLAFDGLWVVLQMQGKLQEAAALKREAAAHARRTAELMEKVESQSADFLSARSGVFGRLGEWRKAADDLNRLLQMRPDDHIFWHSLAPLLVQDRRLDEYRQLCRKSLERFGNTTEPYTAERISKACLILASSGADLGLLGKMTDVAVSAKANQRDLAWFQLVKALFEYRCGNFARAKDWATQAWTNAEANLGLSWDLNVQVEMVLAMARYQLKRTEAAQAVLAKEIDVAEAKLPKLESGDLGAGAWNWVMAQAFISEAKALIGREPDPLTSKAELKSQKEATSAAQPAANKEPKSK